MCDEKHELSSVALFLTLNPSSKRAQAFSRGTTSESPSFEIFENQRSPAPVRWHPSHADSKAAGNSLADRQFGLRSRSQTPMRSRRRVSVSFNVSKNARRERIREQVCMGLFLDPRNWRIYVWTLQFSSLKQGYFADPDQQ